MLELIAAHMIRQLTWILIYPYDNESPLKPIQHHVIWFWSENVTDIELKRALTFRRRPNFIGIQKCQFTRHASINELMFSMGEGETIKFRKKIR